MKELQTVVLRRSLPASGLVRGDVGAIVHAHSGDQYEVEFASGDGVTLAVLTLPGRDLRPIEAGEILHVRALAHP